MLALQHPNGAFGGSFGYGHMDGVWVLAHLLTRADHRREAVRKALERSVQGLMEVFHFEPEAFFTDAHATLSRISALGICHEALPDLFKSSCKWRNPWARRELFAISLPPF